MCLFITIGDYFPLEFKYKSSHTLISSFFSGSKLTSLKKCATTTGIIFDSYTTPQIETLFCSSVNNKKYNYFSPFYNKSYLKCEVILVNSVIYSILCAWLEYSWAFFYSTQPGKKKKIWEEICKNFWPFLFGNAYSKTSSANAFLCKTPLSNQFMP